MRQRIAQLGRMAPISFVVLWALWGRAGPATGQPRWLRYLAVGYVVLVVLGAFVGDPPAPVRGGGVNFRLMIIALPLLFVPVPTVRYAGVAVLYLVAIASIWNAVWQRHLW